MTIPWRRLFRYLVTGSLVIGALVYAFWPQAVPVDIARIGSGELVVTIDGEGRTRVREVYAVSAPISGLLLRIERHVGDPVSANDTVLATIQPTDPTFLDRRARTQAAASVKAAEAAFALAEAERARAAAELDFARAELQRSEQLAKRETISQSDLDRARLEARRQEAAVATAKATVTMRGYELETARAALIEPGTAETAEDGSLCCVDVRSPVDGQILRLIHESEGVVTAGEPLLEVGDPGDLEIVVDLLSGDAMRVAEGARVVIEDWGGAGTLAGRVRRVEPYGFTKLSALGIEEQRVNVIIDLEESPDRWRSLGHGFRVDAHIVIWHGADVLKLPLGALFREGDDWAVFAVENGRASLRRVDIAHGNGREAEIVEGLDEGEAVVLHPGDRISDNARVEPRS